MFSSSSINDNITNFSNNLVTNNEHQLNVEYINSKYNISKLKKNYIIRQLNKKKQVQSNITPQSTYDLKSYLFFVDEYIIVPDNLLNIVSPTKCRNYDIYNIYIYNKNIKLYNEIMKKINNSSFKLNKKPTPLPKISNLERQYLYKKRNEHTNNFLQTKSVLYLLSNNYKLIDDINNIPHTNNNFILFESYQAIELAKELSHIKGDNLNNISLTILDINNNQHTSITTSVDREFTSNINTESNINNVTPSAPLHNILEINNMHCHNPEHHDINKKIKYYNNSKI